MFRRRRLARRSVGTGALLTILAVAPACLQRMNFERDDLRRLSDADGLVFGRIEIAAPESIDADLGRPGEPIETGSGAVADVRGIDSGTRFRFRVPPDGSFRWALPGGSYEIVSWRGILLDSPLELAEARLDLRVRFVVVPSAAAAIGAIAFDGRSLSVTPPAPDELAAFRAALPEFEGEVSARPAAAISVAPPVRTVRFAKPGGSGDSCRERGPRPQSLASGRAVRSWPSSGT